MSLRRKITKALSTQDAPQHRYAIGEYVRIVDGRAFVDTAADEVHTEDCELVKRFGVTFEVVGQEADTEGTITEIHDGFPGGTFYSVGRSGWAFMGWQLAKLGDQ